MDEDEDEIINDVMAAIQPQYPSLTVEELRQIFDETYERLSNAGVVAIDNPVPDELCPHVELGVQMTGGWYFAAHEPPIAVGMCHECILWCREHLDPGMPWANFQRVS